MTSFEVRTTERNQFVEITAEVRRVVREVGLTSGAVVVYCPHTTAAITIQENADPDGGRRVGSLVRRATYRPRRSPPPGQRHLRAPRHRHR